MMEANRKRLVARKSCGCLVAAISYDTDDPSGSAYAARDVARWIARGYRVEEADNETIKREFVGESGCPHKPPEPVQLSLFGD